MPLRVVCAVGPESTGKTTLCRALAERFDVPWLAEYAREYLNAGTSYDSSDVAAIAKEQARREQELIANSRQGVILDTDLAVIVVWWQEKFGALPGWIEAAFRAQTPRLYLLCRPDLSWAPDPLRESPGDLDRLYDVYRRLLTERRLPFVEIAGSGERRTATAVAALRRCGFAAKGANGTDEAAP